ncbi:TetR/AcrR family transcriptional regulator [Puia dinghuensis]|uniref:TetR family transcriptional regulator n=1 Tax=Puia dinghuensis TaxID=1792502 RepID=A0A8J2U9P9_9BACT|nr:TetR/AcrR family transcriptional regulator [Puia dinghuensis]GGA88978.1 TetR family transcriptional regulator [Puia dinghuensis]
MRESAVKDRILDTASRLFYDQGYHVTGINQIIEEADIARASLYNHFPSKTDLLLAYLDRTHQEWFVELDEFLAPIPMAREKLLALFDYRLQRQRRYGYKGCPFNKITAETSDDEQVLQRVKVHKEQIRDTIRQLVLQAEHRRLMDDDRLTDTLFLLQEGGIVLGATFRSSNDAEKARQIAESLL